MIALSNTDFLGALLSLELFSNKKFVIFPRR